MSPGPMRTVVSASHSRACATPAASCECQAVNKVTPASRARRASSSGRGFRLWRTTASRAAHDALPRSPLRATEAASRAACTARPRRFQGGHRALPRDRDTKGGMPGARDRIRDRRQFEPLGRQDRGKCASRAIFPKPPRSGSNFTAPHPDRPGGLSGRASVLRSGSVKASA